MAEESKAGGIAAKAAMYIIIFVAQTVAIISLFGEKYQDQQISKEKAYNVEFFGLEGYREIEKEAETIFQAAFVESGAFEISYTTFIPSDNLKKNGHLQHRPVIDEAFQAAEVRLNVFWYSVNQAIERGMIMLRFVPLFFIFLAAACVDGWAVREIKKATYGWVSPRQFTLASKGLSAIVLGAPFYLFFPFTIHPYVLVGLLVSAAISMQIMLSNIPKKF